MSLKYPAYSAFANSFGTIKPPKTAYANLPSIIELMEQAKAENKPVSVPAEYENLYKFPKEILEQTANIQNFVKNDDAPIPATEDREGYYGERHIDWWYSGLMTWLRIRQLYATYCRPLRAGDVYFELGCATGRVLRHALFQNPDLKITGCDLNARHVDWMQQFLPLKAMVFQNTFLPQLPLPDNSVDIGVASSVFTHIDDLESAWLMELRRVMKQGSLFFVTIMSERYWIKCGNHSSWSWVLDNLLKLDCEIPLTRESFAEQMPQDRIVLAYKNQVYNSTLFHHSDYIKRVWSRYLTVVDIIENCFDIQDMVILRKDNQ